MGIETALSAAATLGGGYLASQSGGGGGAPQTATTNNAPWSGVQPYLSDVYGAASQNYRQPGPFQYPFNTFAGPNQLELGSQAQMLGSVPGFNQFSNQVGNSMGFAMGPGLYAESNPYLQSAMDAANRGTIRQFNEQVMPGIGGQAIQAGQYGSDRHGVAEGIAAQGLQDIIGAQNAAMAFQGYNEGLGQQARAWSLSPQAMQMALMGPQVMQQVGGTQRAWEQQYLDELVNRWSYHEGLPQQQLSDYAAIVSGLPSGGGTSTTTGTGQQMASNPVLSALGGAQIGNSLYNSFAGGESSPAVPSIAAATIMEPWLSTNALLGYR